jgi:seryl-tRNA synthetase
MLLSINLPKVVIEEAIKKTGSLPGFHDAIFFQLTVYLLHLHF